MSDLRSEKAREAHHRMPSVPVLDGVPLMLMTEVELIGAMRFEGKTRSFRAWCRKLGIRPVPGRTGIYDPKLVRERLDESQCLKAPPPAAVADPPLSLVEQRRMRRGKQAG